MFYIYSGGSIQSKNLADAMNLGHKEWRPINIKDDLYGPIGGTLLLYRTWNENPRQEIYDVLKRAQEKRMLILEVTSDIDDKYFTPPTTKS